MYSILQSKDGEMVLIIEPQDCAPDGPMFIYDGGDIVRDYIAPVRIVHDVKSLMM